jgi:hypothetical protein
LAKNCLRHIAFHVGIMGVMVTLYGLRAGNPGDEIVGPVPGVSRMTGGSEVKLKIAIILAGGVLLGAALGAGAGYLSSCAGGG